MNSTPPELMPIALADNLLEPWRSALGGDYDGYRNHVQRVLIFSRMLRALDSESLEKLAIAGAFHDLGIWAESTFDYLEPSCTIAKQYLESSDRMAWWPEIETIIELHHKLSSAADHSPLAEVFRQADGIDVSLGMRRHGLERAAIRQVLLAFPDHGFHMRLVTLALKRIVTHPWNPLPMVKR
jgi:hypothetical protein